MTGLYCLNCRNEIHKVAYSFKGKGYLDEKCWEKELAKPSN